MLNQIRQNISTKESVIFCILGGLFVYFVCSIPLILFRLFPPTQPKRIHLQFTTIYPPKYEVFIISLSFFAFFGIRFLRKVDFQNWTTYFSLLAFILAVGGGFLTGALETIYYIFMVGDNSNQEYFWATLDESYYGFEYSIKWILAFMVIQIPFTSIFLLIKFLINRFSIRSSLK